MGQLLGSGIYHSEDGAEVRGRDIIVSRGHDPGDKLEPGRLTSLPQRRAGREGGGASPNALDHEVLFLGAHLYDKQ